MQSLLKYEPHTHIRHETTCCLRGFPSTLGSFRLSVYSEHPIEFGILLKAVDLLPNTSRRTNASTLSASGAMLINDIHTRWSLRVAVEGDEAKDSSLERQPELLWSFFFIYLFVIGKSQRDVFVSTETTLKEDLEKFSPLFLYKKKQQQ